MRARSFAPNRRAVMQGACGALLLGASVARAAEPDLAGLSDMTGDVGPITLAEREARLARAQALMRAHGLGAVLIEPGASMAYFTGVRWSRSERLTAAVLPVDGEPLVVTPFFEEPSVRQTLAVPAEVRVWQEERRRLEQLP